MTIRLVHAVAAILTMLLLFIRQKCAFAGICPAKRRESETACSCGDTSLTSIPLSSENCIHRLGGASFDEAPCDLPKYKRDPEIIVDNENMGQPQD